METVVGTWKLWGCQCNVAHVEPEIARRTVLKSEVSATQPSNRSGPQVFTSDFLVVMITIEMPGSLSASLFHTWRNFNALVELTGHRLIALSIASHLRCTSSEKLTSNSCSSRQSGRLKLHIQAATFKRCMNWPHSLIMISNWANNPTYEAGFDPVDIGALRGEGAAYVTIADQRRVFHSQVQHSNALLLQRVSYPPLLSQLSPLM